MERKPRVAVFKFASCDGCQLTLLDCEDELLAVGEQLDIVHFLEATDRREPGPYDVALVEGSITTPKDLERIWEVRRENQISGNDRRLRDFRRNSSLAELGQPCGLSSHCLCFAAIYRILSHFDGDCRSCAG